MKALNSVKEHAHKILQASQVAALLNWDRETMMPPAGANQRAEQLAYMDGHIHSLVTDATYMAQLKELSESQTLDQETRRSVACQLRDSLRASLVPSELVEDLSRTSVHSHGAWVEARKNGNFAQFQPHLEKVVELKKRFASYVATSKQTPYEALLAEYEPDFSLAEIEKLFSELRAELVPLAAKIVASSKPVQLQTKMPIPLQRELSIEALKFVRFDLNMGRVDEAVHPFCSGHGQDVRVTTRYRESDWADSLFSVLHECGHGLFELGMGRSPFDPMLRQSPSFGMHESQSRFLENCIGRSTAFLKAFLSHMQKQTKFAPYMKLEASQLFRHVNHPRFSYIRVDADEVTYNLHVLLRFELEKALFVGDLKVSDLPEAWNDKVANYLHLAPPEPSQGVLQDTHWSWGAFGYFPSYTVGNLIAAELYYSLQKDLPDFAELVSRGEFAPIQNWLFEHVHQYGRMRTTPEIVTAITGRSLTHHSFIRYLGEKFSG